MLREKDWKNGFIHICIWENPCTCHLNCAPSLGPAISTQKRMTDWQQKATCHSEKWKVLWRTPKRTYWSLEPLLLWLGDRKISVEKCNVQGLRALVLWHFFLAEVKHLGDRSCSGINITEHSNNLMKQTDLKKLRCPTCLALMEGLLLVCAKDDNYFQSI